MKKKLLKKRCTEYAMFDQKYHVIAKIVVTKPQSYYILKPKNDVDAVGQDILHQNSINTLSQEMHELAIPKSYFSGRMQCRKIRKPCV